MLMVPSVLLPPATPPTAQVTLLFAAPLTVAVKVDVWPTSRAAVAGETVTVTGVTAVPDGLPPPQARQSSA